MSKVLVTLREKSGIGLGNRVAAAGLKDLLSRHYGPSVQRNFYIGLFWDETNSRRGHRPVVSAAAWV